MEAPDTDHQRALVQRARAGDAQAAEELLRQFEASLRTHLRQRVGTRLQRFAELDDLLQEVQASFVESLPRLGADADIDDFKRLLFRHAGWVLGKAGRKASRFAGESVTPEISERQNETPTVGPVTRADQKEWMTERIRNLGEDSAAVMLGFLAGKTFAEIAEELEISEDTVRMRFLRSSRKLAEENQADNA